MALYIPLFLAVLQAYFLIGEKNTEIVVGLSILSAATSYSLVALGFITMLLVLERNAYESQAHRDALTGLYNRWGLDSAFDLISAQSLRENTEVSAIICDIDFFKTVNDTYGHDIGDTVLKSCALMIHKVVRASDLCSRYGGEEFIVILPKTDILGAKTVADKIRSKVESMEIQIPDGTVQLTVSLGVSCQKKEIDIDSLIKMADDALYQAKSNGRNQVCIYSE
ncbi:MAG: GGDEF domain-containing protein [Spirochaetaceae bacterium]|nr:GGDEF domain-containing protein [Spirochaetaceae bacterium]